MQGPLHPSLVHLPLGLSLAIPLVAAGLALAIRCDWLPRRAWLVVPVLQALLLAGGGIAFAAGEQDGRRVEEVVSHRLVEEHEERAEVFLWAAGAVLAVSAAGLVASRRYLPAVAGAAVAGSLAVAGLGVWTGLAGGDLVYRHGAAAAFAPRAQATAAKEPPQDKGE